MKKWKGRRKGGKNLDRNLTSSNTAESEARPEMEVLKSAVKKSVASLWILCSKTSKMSTGFKSVLFLLKK